MTDSHPAVAIVGLSCRFPGARDVGQYWANLAAGRDTITRFDPARLAAAGVDQRLLRHPDFVPARGEVVEGEYFDRAFFGYSPAAATSIDPQHRVLLEESSAALDDAGIDPQRFAGLVGVFAGCDAVEPSPIERDADELAWLIGQDKDFLATRVAYKLGLRGPAITVQTACSTSLVAVHTACQSLLGYECDAALAGGVSLTLPQASGYLYQDGHILSRDGRCRPFDADATGTVPSSGVGVVVLRRLADALADGERVIAVIRGSAINNDGGEKIGYTAPSIVGQRDVIRFALAQSGAEAGDVGYVEAHGTGTRVGDPVEVAALSAAFRETTDETGFCWLGAAKSNIGHTSSASGVAGLIKTALMLERRTLLPTVHFRRPNPELELDSTPFRISTELRPWDLSRRPLAGVSSFGIGGTNAHAVLEPAPTRHRPAAASGRSRLLCLSAATPSALDTLRTEIADRLAGDAPRLDDVAFTLADGRRRFPNRLTVVADDPAAAARALREARPSAPAGVEPTVGFLFPGQGSLRVGAGSAAHRALPVFRRIFDEIRAESLDRFGVDLGRLLDPGTEPSWADDPVNQQLGLFAIGYALAGQFREWGIQPAAMLGNSVGEYVAAAVAGVWDLSVALTVLWQRGIAMREAHTGRMLAVTLPRDELAALCTPESRLTMAIDAPGYGVLAGDEQAVEALRGRLAERGTPGRLLDTERAFHSPSMRTAADEFRAALANLSFASATVDLLSNLTGTWTEPEQVRSPAYWADQTVGTVRLADCVGRLLSSPCDVFVELGPDATMTKALRRHPDWSGDRIAVPLLGRSSAEATTLPAALGRLWERGLPVDVTDLLGDAERIRCQLPPHPFARTEVPARVKAGAPAPVEPAVPLSSLRWAETAGARGTYDAIVALGPFDSTTRRLVDALARADAVVRYGPDDPSPSTELLDSALDQLADASAPAIVISLAGMVDSRLADLLDEFADQVGRRGATVVVLGHGLVDGPDMPSNDHRAEGRAELLALARHRSTLRPAGAIRIIDTGDGEPPQRAPAMAAGDVVHAWRGRRWWVLAPQPVPDTVANSGSGPAFAVIDLGAADGAGAAAELAAHGLPVAAFVPAWQDESPGARPTAVAASVAWEDTTASLSRSPELLSALDSYCVAQIGEFVCTRAQLRAGDRIDEDTLRKRLSPNRTLPPMIDFFLRVLTERGWLRQVDGLFEVDERVDASTTGTLGRQESLDAVDGLRRLLRYCVDAYPEVFDGEREPASVLFPDGQEDLLREHVADNEITIGDDDACLAALCAAARIVCAARAGRPLRILEVGGGGGALTWQLLDGWPGDTEITYHFTDVSALRVRQARERAAAEGRSNVRCSTFDITRDPVEQGFAPGTYDLVLAYNVVHLAPVVRDGLDHLRRLLAPGGVLGMVELATVPLWMNMIWGLAPGWWGFDDDLRDGSVHVDPAVWQQVLADVGMTEFARLPEDPNADHVLVLASEAPASPADYVAAELCRQAPGTDFGGLLGLARPDPESPHAAAVLWRRARETRLGEAPMAWLVSEDGAPESGWRGQRTRRLLDPPDEDAEPPWRHVEVSDLGAAELAPLPNLLGRNDIPPVVRLAGSTLSAPAGDRVDEPLPAPEPSATPDHPLTSVRDPLTDVVAGIWRDVLGVPTAEATDDFFDLGGDSLTAVHLTARVREHVGQPVSLTAFTASATFGDLVRLAQDTERAAIDPAPVHVTVRTTAEVRSGPVNQDDLLVFRDGGTRAPLFLAAPATGSSLCYRRLARLLDDDQPCYGLESPGLHDGRRPPRHFEDVAAHHIEVMRQVRPKGPYLVGGWSVGAMVAHEMARQLAAQGEDAPLVVCVDSAVVDTNGWPLAVAPGIAARGLWYQVQVRLPRWARGARQQIAELIDVPGAPDFGGIFDANIRAMLRYQPRPVPARAVVFMTRHDARARAQLRRQVAPLYEHGVDIRPAPGDHWTILGPRHVGRLAEDLGHVLDEYTPETGDLVSTGRTR